MTPLVAVARDRLARLAAALLDLRDRVRQAVTAELERMIGDTARDLVAGGPSAVPEPRDQHRPAASGRRQSPDPWDDDENGREEADPGSVDVPDPVPDFPTSPAARWWTAVAAGVGVARRLVAHAAPPWVSTAAGLVVAGLALAGGPVVRAAVAAALLALTDPPRSP